MEKNKKIDLLYKLKKEVEKSNNRQLVEQINEVIKKVYEEKRIISLVGHFSSGKSSLINHILDEDILPSSPVPTTSNAAQLTISDTAEIIVNLVNHEYAVVDDYAEVKRINTENQKIESVEIKHPSQYLRNGLTLQDTPGIDATFSNHEENTMKFLLTSDVILYTVEYNHVESEKNFKEMKALNTLGVPLFLVVNQIDKHDESEVKFEDFKAAIVSNINLWDIKLEGLYFTSIYETPLNQFEAFKAHIIDDTTVLDQSYAQFFDRITKYIVDEQLKYLEDRQQYLLDEMNITADQFEAYSKSQLEKQTVTNEQTHFKSETSTEQYFLASIREILKNAYIVPFEIRERLKSVLEVYDADYKVGGLFGRDKKKQALKDERMQGALSDLNASIEKQVNFHIRSLFQKNAVYVNIPEGVDFKYELNTQDLEQLMNTQASFNNDYVLNYTDQVKKFIESDVVRMLRPVIRQFNEAIDHTQFENIAVTETEVISNYRKNLELIESLTTENYRHYYIHVDDSIDKLIDRTQVTLTLGDTVEQKQSVVTKKTTAAVDISESKTRLQQFEGIHYFDDITKRLKTQLERIEQDVTRIVVFGAFSAGKSSLINAMIGERVLISSPNPTTAAITEISYGSQHKVKFKTDDMLLGELNRIGRLVDIHEPTISAWMKTFNKKRPDLDRQFLKFIQAIEQNYELYMNRIQSQELLPIQDHEIERFTAEDAHSAFVDRIYLEYEHPFLKDKVIIDSPGIGSTNMRHTNETTQIIADSDLLIYVSYFNHVFTENDKAFITYLNDLQILSEDSDTFYVINAVDLARNEAELNQVSTYFESELSALNVPATLFKVSSKKAIDTPDADFERFKSAVQKFAEVDSRTQKIVQFNRGVQALERQAQEIVQNYAAAKAQEQQNHEYYDRLSAQLPYKESQVSQAVHKGLQEVDEQLIYLKDKFKIQLYDLIKLYFNTRVVDERKQYLYHLSSKLEEETSMIVPRVNYQMEKSLNDNRIVIEQELEAHQLFASYQSLDLIPVHQDFMDEALDTLSIKINKKQYNSKESINALYEAIHKESTAMLESRLNQYRAAVESYLQEQSNTWEKAWLSNNHSIAEAIAERKQHQLDDSVIKEIQKIQ